MFEGFDAASFELAGATIYARIGGSGPPVLLLHGFPETHVMWHHVAAHLAKRFTVVCADLRGYGRSSKPSSAADHAPYSKRAMGADMFELMGVLGFERFAVAGHDRGGRAAYRMALDRPGRITRLAVLDIVPTGEVFARADRRMALQYWPWSLFSQPAPLPESLLAAASDAVVDHALREWGTLPEAVPDVVREMYVEALRDPRAHHAICEEFRAAATIDARMDDADASAGCRIRCPTLVLWAEGGPVDTWYADTGGPLGIWRRWCETITGHPIGGGHFFPESNSAATADALERFFAADVRE
jgi:haloacetate dehalogenase